LKNLDINKAPSSLASSGHYVFTLDIFDIIHNQIVGDDGKIQLSDAINSQAENNAVESVTLKGRRFDCGSVKGYVEAIDYISSNNKFA
jgi:UTP--glucose-1-phosphate uridylyltransferase